VIYSDRTEKQAVVKELRQVGLARAAEDTWPQMAKRLTREALVWHDLHHENIVPLLGITLHPSFGLISPWYEYGNVARYLKRHPEANRTMLTQDIALGVSYLHSQSPPVIHGDLKPDNVLIGPTGRAKISDFGLSAAFEDLQLFTTVSLYAGSARYMAPEVVEGTAHKSCSSNVYSFGTVAFEIVTGATPFGSLRQDTQVILAISQGKKPLSTDVSYPRLQGPMGNLLQECWTSVPTGRPSMSDISSQLSLL